MTYEEFYKEVVAVKDMNYSDPSDFANDVLALLGKFRDEHTAQQSAHPTNCPVCLGKDNLPVGEDWLVCSACHGTGIRG